MTKELNSSEKNMGNPSDPKHVCEIDELVYLVQAMVEQSGNPVGFDARSWVTAWLASPIPALGGATPNSYMSTTEGQKIVKNLLAASQSGAFV
jgi:hypothetical protein